MTGVHRRNESSELEPCLIHRHGLSPMRSPHQHWFQSRSFSSQRTTFTTPSFAMSRWGNYGTIRKNLTRNDFPFNFENVLQIHGTAMGKKLAPAYANMYMAHWEHTFPKPDPSSLTVFRIFGWHLWGLVTRSSYIQGVLGDSQCTPCHGHQIHYQSPFWTPQFFFTPFINGNKTLHTKIYFRNTDTLSLLHKTSYHPEHTFRGLIKSQLIRFYRICSFEHHFQEATQTLVKVRKGYCVFLLKWTVCLSKC